MIRKTAIAIITARGGSKRIPKKNVKEFCGKPILVYSIEAALQSGIFDEVMVSTDSEEIKSIALSAGASVPFMRSQETSGDYATTADVLDEVLEAYLQRGIKYDFMCCIYPTAPFVTGEKLRSAYKKLTVDGDDSVMPIVQYSFPPQRAGVIRNGRYTYLHPDDFRKRSQDLEPIYHDAGQFYFYKLDSKNAFNFQNPGALVVDGLEVQDIDTEEDWAIAEMKYCLMIERNS